MKTHVFIILATATLLFLSYGPIVENYRATPPDRFYFGQSEYPIDMLGDLAYIQEGYQGNLLASFNYSTMIGGHPSIVKMEYTLIGLLGRVLNVSPLPMFIISRLVISLCVFAVIYLVVRNIFREPWQRIVSYVLVLFGTGIILPGIPNHLVGYDALVFPRLTQAMPHYLLGAGIILLALYFLSQTLERPKRTAVFLLSLVFGVVSSLLYAPDNVLLISGFPLYIMFDSTRTYLRTRRVRVNTANIGILFAYAAVTLAPTVYVRYVMNTLWNDIRVARMEQLFPFHVPPAEYVLAVGVLYLLSFIAVPSVIRKGRPLTMLLATWLVAHPVGEYIVSPLIHINYFRYFLTPYYVAYGILGTIGITIIADWIQKYLGYMRRWIIVSVCTIAVLATSIGMYASVWREEHLCFCLAKFYDFAYPTKTVMDGIFWLQRNTNPNDVVLSGYYAGTLIAAFSGNHPYVTWWYRLVEPPTIQNTERSLAAFYSGSMSEKDALTFLTQQRISYVFYSEQEQLFANRKQTLAYPFLTEHYNKGGTRIYQVQ